MDCVDFGYTKRERLGQGAGGLLWSTAVRWRRKGERERKGGIGRKLLDGVPVKRFSLWIPETERHCSARGYENLTRRNSGFSRIVYTPLRIHSRILDPSFFLARRFYFPPILFLCCLIHGFPPPFRSFLSCHLQFFWLINRVGCIVFHSKRFPLVKLEILGLGCGLR